MLRGAQVRSLVPQGRAKGRTKQHSQPGRCVLLVEKTFHTSPLQKTIARSLANHRPKVFNKFPVSELANHHKSSEAIGSLIYMVGNGSYTGKWGIKMCLQNLDAQKFLPSQLCIRTPDLMCPCPALFLDSPFPGAASAGSCGSRQVSDFSRKELRFSREGFWTAIQHRRSFPRVHARLAQSTVPPARLGRSSSGTGANPAAGVQAGKHGTRGAALPHLLLPYMAGKGKNTKNHYRCLALPIVWLCLVLFLNFPDLTIQSAIFQARCLLKVFGKGQPTIQLFLKRK